MTDLPPPDPAPLLRWYDRHRRDRPRAGPAPSSAAAAPGLSPDLPAPAGDGPDLPWRAPPGAVPDPYRVWLSEVMLQQTTVAAVAPRFRRFLARFPDVAALAAAPVEAVMEEWAGLGYYARARNLHACARAVAAAGGSFPADPAALRALPGVGAYTAAAVAAIAFGAPVVPVDANVERVVARLFAVETPLPAARPRLAALAAGLMRAEARGRPADFAQALFDLGATVCTPRRPACALCPWRETCAAHRAGLQGTLPRKAPRAERGLRHGVHFLLRDAAGAVLLRRRPPSGLLGGMPGLPGTPWREAPWTLAEALAFAPDPPGGALEWTRRPGVAEHGFTHFRLAMTLAEAVLPAGAAPPEGEWRLPGEARRVLPTALRAVLALAGD